MTALTLNAPYCWAQPDRPALHYVQFAPQAAAAPVANTRPVNLGGGCALYSRHLKSGGSGPWQRSNSWE
jgi:hypothetical protein